MNKLKHWEKGFVPTYHPTKEDLEAFEKAEINFKREHYEQMCSTYSYYVAQNFELKLKIRKLKEKHGEPLDDETPS